MKTGQWFYAFYAGAVSLLIGGVGAIILFAGTNSGLRAGIDLLAYMVVIFDLGMIAKRFTSNALIEPAHLAIYPLTKGQKVQFQAALLLSDYKTGLYVVGIILFSIYFAIHASYSALFAGIFIWILLLTVVLSWSLVGYHLAGRHLAAQKSRLQWVIFLLYGFLVFGIDFLGQNIMTKIPVSGYAGNALFGLITYNLPVTGINVLLLAGFLTAAWLVIGLTKPNY